MFQSILTRWQAAGIVLRPGVAENDLDEFERENKVRMPAEMRAFYRECDGMDSGQWDEIMMRFWPLSEVRSVPSILPAWKGTPDYSEIAQLLPDAASYYVFTDHSIGIFVHAVRLSADPMAANDVVRISGEEWHSHSPSFAEFMRRYEENPVSVF